jgi:hypothetical protein
VHTNSRHRIGRRWGLIQDATIMFIGLLMLTAAWGVTQNGWVICYAWSLFFYSVGVGTFPGFPPSQCRKKRAANLVPQVVNTP